MGAIPASFLPPRELWPDRVYTLPEHGRYPARLNSTEELIDRPVEAGHRDRVALRCEDQRTTYRELRAAASRLGSALRALPRAPGPAGPGAGKLLRRVLREQAERE
jgi:2-aminobenzoate-CoA ligase